MRYEVRPDGSLGAGSLFTEGPGIGDGMKVDVNGNVYSTSGAGPGVVRITAPSGTLLGYLNLPIVGGEPKRQICATNVAFGDRGRQELVRHRLRRRVPNSTQGRRRDAGPQAVAPKPRRTNMRWSHVVSVALAAAGLSSNAFAQSSPPRRVLAHSLQRPASPSSSSTSGGRQRSYRLFVPQSYDGRTPLALVLDLHGSGGTSAGQAGTSRFEALAAREGFAVATLQAGAEGNRWNVPLTDRTPRRRSVRVRRHRSRRGARVYGLSLASTRRAFPAVRACRRCSRAS